MECYFVYVHTFLPSDASLRDATVGRIAYAPFIFITKKIPNVNFSAQKTPQND